MAIPSVNPPQSRSPLSLVLVLRIAAAGGRDECPVLDTREFELSRLLLNRLVLKAALRRAEELRGKAARAPRRTS